MRIVDPLLQEYMETHGLHMARICRIGPVPLRSGAYFGLSFLDRNLTYQGLEYIARTGAEMTDHQATSDLSVDNSEMRSLQPLDAYPLEGISKEEIARGALDAVPFVVYCVNYTDLTKGHFIWSAGTIGEVRLPGTSYVTLEQRSLTNKMLQIIGDVDSTTCRVKRLGSQYLGSEGIDSWGESITTEKFPCLYDVTQENISAIVTGIDADEPDLIFQDASLGQAENYFAPGTVLFNTGANTGIEREIEAFENGIIQLKNALPVPAEVGDEFRIRRECTFYVIGHNSCQTFHGTSWPIRFRGEPYIPVGDASANLVAGVAVPTDIGGTGEPLPDSDPGNPTDPGGGGGGQSFSGGGTSRTFDGSFIVDPATYGASSGASAATNTTAFNTALGVIEAHSGGGVLRPGAGPFNVTPGAIFIPSNTFVDFVTNNTELRAVYASTDRKSVLEVRTESQVEIAGGTIRGFLDAWLDAGGSGAHPGLFERCHGIAVFGSSAVTVRDMTILDCVGDGVSVGRQTTGVTPNDVVVDNIVSLGHWRQGVTVGRSTNVYVQNNEIAFISGTSPQAGIDVEPDNPDTENSSDTFLLNNWIHDCAGPSILCYRSADDVTISGNTLESSSIGISTYEANNTDITGNVIRHQRNHGIKLQSGTTGASISGNTFWDNSTGSTPDLTQETSTNITGTNSTTAPHINKSSDSTATIGSNTYQT